MLTGGAGADTLVGDAGLDLVSYAGSPAAVTVDLPAGTVTGGAATGDTISAVEGAVGSAFADTLTGDGADNIVMGMGGADALDGGAGDDLVYYLYSTSAVTVNLTAQTASGGHATGTPGRLRRGAGLGVRRCAQPKTDHGGRRSGSVGSGFGGTGVDTFNGGGPGTDTCDAVPGEVAVLREQGEAAPASCQRAGNRDGRVPSRQRHRSRRQAGFQFMLPYGCR